MASGLDGKRILLVITGGIAAYKSLELIRLIRKSGASVRCILTDGGAKFVTALSVASLSGDQCYTDLWSLKDEAEMGHIRLSREADLVVVAPASANMIAKMAHGLADDLASTALLATDKPVLIAPAMNIEMWAHPAVQANIRILQAFGILQIGPGTGDTACGETGAGRMAEPAEILAAITAVLPRPCGERAGVRGGLAPTAQNSPPHPTLSPQGRGFIDSSALPLRYCTAIVTSGPTHEPIDPVRYIGNRSSGKQGHAIAAALAQRGARVTLVTGPVALPDPPGVTTLHVETAQEMMAACTGALPADIAVCAAAVSDWSVAPSDRKIKKTATPPTLDLRENPDILALLCASPARPKLVVGFAAETDDLIDNAKAKRQRKGCDWLLANDAIFGAEDNHVHLVTADDVEDWGPQTKTAVAATLADRIARHFTDHVPDFTETDE